MSVYNCLCGEYTFFVLYGTIETEVFPLNFLETSLKDEKEEDFQFYRRKFQGSLIFGGKQRLADWEYFYDINTVSPCDELVLTIYRDGVEYWRGYFSVTDGAFDFDTCTFEIVPLCYDAYRDLLEKKDTEYNILSYVSHDVVTNAIRLGIGEVYSRNMWLMDIIEFLGSHVSYGLKPGCTISSDFFTEATNPATGRANELLYLTMACKSDIIDPLATNPQETAMLSWQGMMDILWAMFQVTWNYDSATDTINVEHISWFGVGAVIDTTDQKIARGHNRYASGKEKLPKYEYFRFAEANDDNFVGSYIYYPDVCVSGDYKTNKITTAVNVTTDLEYIINSPDLISTDGWVILCNYEVAGPAYYVVNGIGCLDPRFVRLNMPLSWANLHNNYYRHYRSHTDGIMNESATDFFTAKKSKRQDLSIIMCDEFDPESQFKTELGDDYLGGQYGLLERAEISPAGNIIMSLLYGVPDNPFGPVPLPKVCVFYQTDLKVEAWLSQPCDANYVMHFWEEIYDAAPGCAFICSEGQPADPEAYSININDTYKSHTLVDVCGAYGGVKSLFLQIDEAAMVANGWTVYMWRDCDYADPDCVACGEP